VNYLSHYFIDRNNPDPEFVLGLMMPDLIRGFDPDKKLKYGNIKKVVVPSEFADVHGGVMKHHLVDAYFHNSKYFKANCKLIESTFKKYPIAASNKYQHFLSHIFLEMLIDRYLIIEHPNIINEFYGILEKADNEKINNYFDYIGLSSIKEPFTSFLRKFVELRFLANYTDNNLFIKALIDVYKKVGLSLNLNHNELNNILLDLKKDLMPTYKSIFLKTTFN